MSSALRRAWFLINIVVTVALVPMLFPSHEGGSDTAVAAGAATFESRPIVVTVPPSTILIPTTTTTAPPPPTGSESGRATWYDYKPGICAHKTLPFGTVVTVHAVNGKSVQCTVGDRGPFVDGYVIDLNQREFEQLAPTSAGRIDCTITW